MPKSNKHKKARAADFAKAKLKLGKGKQLAANATNTSFASRSIGLPSQSLAVTKDAPTTRRNLTLPDLLIQCRHYSPSVKKEALTELSSLLASYPFLLLQHLLPLISHLSHLISDAAPSIRKQSIELLRYIFDELPVESLEGSSQGLILFTVASLSSLDEEIRIDALKVLDLLLERIPAEIVRGWDGGMEAEVERKGSLEDKGVGGKVVEALLGVLRVRSAGLALGQGGYTSAASADLSPASRLAILTTLASFLRTAFSPIASTSTAPPPWYLSNSFSTLRSYDSFVRSFTSSPPDSRHTTFPSTDGSLESSSLAFALPPPDFSLDFLELPTPPKLATLTTAAVPPTLLSLLHPTLLSSFLDSAPTAFAPTLESMGIDAHLTTVAAVIGVARELYWSELGGVEVEGMERERESARTMLVAMLGHVGIYFPFGGDALGERTAEADAQLLSLNLTFASLVSLLVLSAPSSSAARRPKGKQTKTKARKEGETNARIELMVHNVSEWVVAALRGEITTTTSPLGIALTPDAYSALEPTIWSLLNQPPTPTADGPQASERVFDGVLDHFAKTSAFSESKKRAFEFIARAVLIQEDSAYANRFELVAEPGAKISAWLLSLPKYLWELGSKHLATTDLVLTFLRRMASQGDKGFFPTSVLASLQAPLVPFFHLQHPSRGAMPGPFLRLPVELQRKAVDLVWYLLKEDEGGRKLGASVGEAAKGVGEEIGERWERRVRN